MIDAMKPLVGKALTVTGPVEPEALGKVMMHEHLHSDWSQKDEVPFDARKWPTLENEAVPALKELKKLGCHAYIDMTRPPERAEGWVYRKVSEMAGFHIILCTGFYREIELGTYWAQTPEDQIWPFVRESSVEELAEFCLREVKKGIQNSGILPGVLKIASSAKEFTDAERKAAIAVARIQKQTGLLINTHALSSGVFKTQLDLLENEGVNPERVSLGHTQNRIADEWPAVRDCMKRGATFALTNLRPGEKTPKAILRAFDEGFGDHLTLGMDGSFTVGYAEIKDNPKWRPHRGDSARLVWSIAPPPPFTYFFTEIIPYFKTQGITDEMLEIMLVKTPQRIIPVQ